MKVEAEKGTEVEVWIWLLNDDRQYFDRGY